MADRFAIMGHTGEDSYTPYEVVATFDTKEMAERYLKKAVGNDSEAMYPYRLDSVLSSFLRGAYVEPAGEKVPPHNPVLPG